MKKRKYFIFLLILFLFGYSGCSSFEEKESYEQKEAALRPKRFGATYMTMNNPYFVALNDSIKEVVEANGDILLTRDPAQDQEKQNQQILDLIDEGVSAIFLNPVNSVDVKPALEACERAGIPVFNVDAQVQDVEFVESVILSDNYNAGGQCAFDIIEKLPAGADIIILDSPDATSAVERVKGFQNTLEHYGTKEHRIISVRDAKGEMEVAMKVMEELILSDIKFDVVFGENDPTALGAVAALRSYNITDVSVYGIDGSPDAKAMILEGRIEGTSAQKPIKMGTKVAKMAYRFLEGKEIEEYTTINVEFINKRNLNKFSMTGWQ